MLVNFTESSQYVGLMDSEALYWPQFTQIDNYDSLIVEIKFPVQSGPKSRGRREKSPGFMRMTDNARAFSAKPMKNPCINP
jgi:hypothetical protein